MFKLRLLLAFLAGVSVVVTLFQIRQYSMQNPTRLQPLVRQQRVGYPKGTILSGSSSQTRLAIVSVRRAPAKIITDVRQTSINDTEVENLRTSEPFINILQYLRRNVTTSEAHQGENDLAQEMFKKIRILCWIMTQPDNHKTRARTVKQTWGKRCNVLYFVSTAQVENQTTVIYQGNESRSILWGKTKLGFKYAYDHHFDDADWFIKADDDTYLIMENMRLLLLDKDPVTPVYYGCRFKAVVQQGYMSGGAGYILSKEALRLFVEGSLTNNSKCKQDDDGAEDVEIGFCLQNVGVAAGDSRDQEGKPRFFPLNPQSMVNPALILNDTQFWYWAYTYYKHEMGIECCSDSVIGFHYADASIMLLIEYLVYHVHPFGTHPQLTGSKIIDDVMHYLNHLNVTTVTKSPASTSSRRPSTKLAQINKTTGRVASGRGIVRRTNMTTVGSSATFVAT